MIKEEDECEKLIVRYHRLRQGKSGSILETIVGNKNNEYDCPECSGWGRYKEVLPKQTFAEWRPPKIYVCKKCNGTGKIDPIRRYQESSS